MLNSKGKPVKRGDLILALDRVAHENDMTIYWKKMKDHSHVDNPDKIGNDIAGHLVMRGALSGNWRLP